jgi:hypothetical protein
MSTFSKFFDMIKSPAAMAVVGIGGVVLAIYQGFFYEKRGDLTVSIDALSRVFDLHQSVGSLEISYAGKNLRAARKTLWTISLTLKNTGNAEIRKGDFDEAVPLGFKFTGAEVVETPTLNTSVAYLAENVKMRNSSDTIFLSPVIWEAGDTVQVNALLLGAESQRPSVAPVGKIAGIRSIHIVELENKEPEKGIWGLIFEGDKLWVYPARIVAYVFVGLFAAAVFISLPIQLLLVPISAIRQKVHRRHRRDQVARIFGAQAPGSITAQLLELYVQEGPEALRNIAKYSFRLDRRKVIAQALEGRTDADILRAIVRTMEPIYVEGLTFKELKNMELIEGDGAYTSLVAGVKEANQELAEKLNIDLPSSAPKGKFEFTASPFSRVPGYDIADRSE